MLILDNFETPWEPLASRDEVETLLAQLTDIPNLTLVVTLRGAERPSKSNGRVPSCHLSQHSTPRRL